MYNEIIKLISMLETANIPFEQIDFNGGKVVKYPKWENYTCSIIEHNGSYGREEDLLEIMGLLTDEESEIDDVVGYLTAEEVFKRVKEDYENTDKDNKTKKLETFSFIGCASEEVKVGELYHFGQLVDGEGDIQSLLEDGCVGIGEYIIEFEIHDRDYDDILTSLVKVTDIY